MKCCVCGKEAPPYAKTIRFDAERSRWVDADGFVCSEVCGQLWTVKDTEVDFTTQLGRWT